MRSTLKQQSKEFDALMAKMNAALIGEDIDNVIPALACMIAHSGCIAGAKQEVLKEFLNETIDEYYTDHGPTLEPVYEH